MEMVSVLEKNRCRFQGIDVLVLALRLVDNKAVLYFDAPTPSEALNWYRGKQVLLPFSLDWVLTQVI